MLKLYNTLTKKKEEFKPIDEKDNVVRIPYFDIFSTN